MNTDVWENWIPLMKRKFSEIFWLKGLVPETVVTYMGTELETFLKGRILSYYQNFSL